MNFIGCLLLIGAIHNCFSRIRMTGERYEIDLLATGRVEATDRYLDINESLLEACVCRNASTILTNFL